MPSATDTVARYARRSDDRNSHEAAASIDEKTLSDLHLNILYLLIENGPMTDEELAEKYHEHHRLVPGVYKKLTDARIRHARLDLMGSEKYDARIVKVGRKPLASGRNGSVFALIENRKAA